MEDGHWLCIWVPYIHKSLYKKEARGIRGEGGVIQKQRLEWCSLKMEDNKPRIQAVIGNWQKQRDEVSPRASRSNLLCWHPEFTPVKLSWDLWSLELWEDKFVSVWTIAYVLTCYSSNIKPIQVHKSLAWTLYKEKLSNSELNMLLHLNTLFIHLIHNYWAPTLCQVLHYELEI